jgi:hypothetical protein
MQGSVFWAPSEEGTMQGSVYIQILEVFFFLFEVLEARVLVGGYYRACKAQFIFRSWSFFFSF